MHGANGVIEFLENHVGIIECPIREDIHLGRLQDTDAGQPGVQLIDVVDLLPQVFNGNAPERSSGSVNDP